jgi:Rod binding domain-containing protein
MQPVAATTAARGAGATDAPQPRLVRAAHEFEAQMMKELLKPMTDGDSLAGENDGSGAGSGGALAAFASEALGKALSERGGFGLADRIVRTLSHSGNTP